MFRKRVFFRPLLGAMFCLSGAIQAASGQTYDLSIGEVTTSLTGKKVEALAVNGTIPGPELRFKEGQQAVIHVTNNLDRPTSLHWHGLLLPGEMDGVPGFNGFEEIEPGATFTYRFDLVQSGTYWYHSHSGLQEQAGVYGPLVIDPIDADPTPADRDYVVMLSDFTEERPETIQRNLKIDPAYYNRSKQTVGDLVKDAQSFGWSDTIKNRLAWGRMRMDPTDLADVSGYTFLINGRTASNETAFRFLPGEKVRLRFINGSAMTYFDVRIPGLKMTVVEADGRDVQPVKVDEFRIAVAETYDVIVEPVEADSYSIIAESIDRSGFALAALTSQDNPQLKQPDHRPRTLLDMNDMGMSMDMGSIDMSQHDHASGHEHMNHTAENHARHMREIDKSAKDQAVHDVMDHGAMDHGAMNHGAEADDTKGSADMRALSDDHDHADLPGTPSQPRGWGDGFPANSKVLSYADLKSRVPNDDLRAPQREIIVNLEGNMERYIWTINGKKFSEAEPIELRYGERVRMTFVNDTMMAHPMHLHGMFVELDNGQTTHKPEKHVVNVPPGQSYSVLITADEPGEWAFHCHLLYHMASGMMRKVVVAQLSAEAALQ